jgi:hypothetical protein
MATMKQHLLEAHEAMAEHHTKMAKSHHALSRCYKGMTKVEADDGFQKIASEHSRMAEHHEEAAAYHLGCCKTMKAAIESDLQKLQPDRVSAIAFSDVPADGFGMTARIRAVPRAGAPSPNSDLAKVPEQFRHLVESTED